MVPRKNILACLFLTILLLLAGCKPEEPTEQSSAASEESQQDPSDIPEIESIDPLEEQQKLSEALPQDVLPPVAPSPAPAEPAAIAQEEPANPEFPTGSAEPILETASAAVPESAAQPQLVDEAPPMAAGFSTTLPTSAEGISPTEVEQQILAAINAERDSLGIPPLEEEPLLLASAKIRVAETSGSFSHTRPNNTPYYTVFDETGYSYTNLWHGENLVYVEVVPTEDNSLSLAQKLYSKLEKSPGHYKNMTMEEYQLAGIAVDLSEVGDLVQANAVLIFAGTGKPTLVPIEDAPID